MDLRSGGKAKRYDWIALDGVSSSASPNPTPRVLSEEESGAVFFKKLLSRF